MTQIAYQTDGGVVKLLTKDGGLCTTCCAQVCENAILTYIYSNLGSYITYSGVSAAWPSGFWRIRMAIDDYIPRYGIVSNYELIGLPSQIYNDYKSSWVELAFSCDGVVWDELIYPDPPSKRSLNIYLKTNHEGKSISLITEAAFLFNGGFGANWIRWKLFVKRTTDTNYSRLDGGSMGLSGNLFSLSETYTALFSGNPNTDWQVVIYDY